MKPSRALEGRWLLNSALLLAAWTTAACTANVNILRGISLAPLQPGETLAVDTPLRFVLAGSGQCNTLNIDWGDGTTEPNYFYGTGGYPIDLSGPDVASRTIRHTWTGWGGGKTVSVAAGSGCEGSARMRFNIEPSLYRLALAQAGPNVQACNPLPNRPDLAPRSLVHITTEAAIGQPNGIDFGCGDFGPCIYDADGRPGSSAPDTFPFPGLREFSLVLRVGTQVFQGGTDVSFTTTAPGPLEICLNDSDMSDNTLGYQVNIAVDQLGPP